MPNSLSRRVQHDLILMWRNSSKIRYAGDDRLSFHTAKTQTRRSAWQHSLVGGELRSAEDVAEIAAFFPRKVDNMGRIDGASSNRGGDIARVSRRSTIAAGSRLQSPCSPSNWDSPGIVAALTPGPGASGHAQREGIADQLGWRRHHRSGTGTPVSSPVATARPIRCFPRPSQPNWPVM